MDRPVKIFEKHCVGRNGHTAQGRHSSRGPGGGGPIDGKVWISGTQDRARTRNLRHDPRASLFVYKAKDPTSYGYLTLEGDGHDPRRAERCPKRA